MVKPKKANTGDWTIDILSSTAWLVPDDLAFIALFFPKHPRLIMRCEGIADRIDAIKANDPDAFETLKAYRKNSPARLPPERPKEDPGDRPHGTGVRDVQPSG